jgi:hypothetical protein
VSRKGRARPAEPRRGPGPSPQELKLARRLILLVGILSLPSGAIVWDQAGALPGLLIMSIALTFVVFSLRAMGRIERRR